MASIVIIQGHPDTDRRHFCHGLEAAYREGAEAAGHQVQVLAAASMELPYVTKQEEWLQPPLNPGIIAAQQAVSEAQHLVIIYPLWLGDMPAVLKSFLEHLSCNGFCMAVEQGRWVKKLSGRSGHVYVTMGMPALAYRWFYRAHSLISLKRNILHFSGVSPVRDTLVGSLGPDAPKAMREKALAAAREDGRHAR
jgi:putative NADPH-quinone reductase